LADETRISVDPDVLQSNSNPATPRDYKNLSNEPRETAGQGPRNGSTARQSTPLRTAGIVVQLTSQKPHTSTVAQPRTERTTFQAATTWPLQMAIEDSTHSDALSSPMPIVPEQAFLAAARWHAGGGGRTPRTLVAAGHSALMKSRVRFQGICNKAEPYCCSTPLRSERDRK